MEPGMEEQEDNKKPYKVSGWVVWVRECITPN